MRLFLLDADARPDEDTRIRDDRWRSNFARRQRPMVCQSNKRLQLYSCKLFKSRRGAWYDG